MKKQYSEKLKPADFESKWQKIWEEAKIYSPDLKKANQPYYNLMMFPYPSAEGLHVGNMYAFTGVDVHGRFMRMRGFDVFEPIGLDGFGIHSENYALKVGRHPKEQAKISEANFYRQLRAIGNMFDWTRTVETYAPDYYRWTQWLFVQMFKHGLAYRAKAEVNWCPSCKTVLADEQVLQKSQSVISNEVRDPNRDSKSEGDFSSDKYRTRNDSKVNVCERCGTPVERKDLEQWFFKITDYAERLLQNTYKHSFKWPNKIKLGQRNWIGKKEGINIAYKVKNSKEEIVCFTTTPVNFAATFLILAPEHPSVLKITTKDRLSNINKYIDTVNKQTKEERIAQGREKTGVFTGAYAINHVTGEEIPIWVSDFVLMEVGTGAIQGCPGHDMRDFEFAKKFDLLIKRVVVGPDGDSSPIDRPEQVIQAGESGTMVNSEFLNGLEYSEAMQKTMDYFEEKGWGKRVTTYHLRDWLISRQRYWGAPIPMIYCKKCASEGKSWFTEFNRHSDPSTDGEESPDPKVKPNSKGILTSSRYDGTPQDDNIKWAVGWPASNALRSNAGWFPVSEDQLPVLLPDVADWKPTGTGRGPLAGHPEFYKTTCPECGSPAVRETDVCDTFFDSSWYYLRYPSIGILEVGNGKLDLEQGNLESLKNQEIKKSRNQDQENLTSNFKNSNLFPWDPEITRRWLPIDSYIGGAEHTVLHLLYTRFVWMALRDWGYLEVNPPAGGPQSGEYDPDEPFKRFYAHGLIIKDGAKMSKSKGNVVVPDEYIRLYGADTLRTYLMFLGPFDQGGDFRDTGVAGMYRWLSRVWRLSQSHQSSTFAKASVDKSVISHQSDNGLRTWHKTIKGVTEDLKGLRYNTAIAKLMEFTNFWQDHQNEINQEQVIDFLKLLAPFAPHMSEELYQQLSVISHQSSDNKKFESIHNQKWPEFDPELVRAEKITIVVQVNGKVRDQIEIEAQEANDEYQVKQLVNKSAKVEKWLHNNKIKRTIFVPGKLINFVI